MKRLFFFSVMTMLALALLAGPQTVFASSTPTLAPQTYTVMVGAEDTSQGIELNTYFPRKLRIHVGDTVVFQQNSFEIHTVTFLDGGDLPSTEMLVDPSSNPYGSPLAINPVASTLTPNDGTYNGAGYMNSGIMGIGTPLTSFSLTFTKTGTFTYICLVHGVQMSGQIVVVDPSIPVLSPDKVAKISKNQIKDGMANAQTVIAQANASVPAPVHNTDGTTSYTVMVGYSSGVVDLMSFFPSSLNAHPGDQVTWQLSPSNMAPHTITVLNGAGEPPLFLPYGTDPNTPPTLYFNPAVLAPSNWDKPLTNQGFVNSGLMIPGVYESASIVIGDYTGSLPYFCILHDDAGMQAELNITPR